MYSWEVLIEKLKLFNPNLNYTAVSFLIIILLVSTKNTAWRNTQHGEEWENRTSGHSREKKKNTNMVNENLPTSLNAPNETGWSTPIKWQKLSYLIKQESYLNIRHKKGGNKGECIKDFCKKVDEGCVKQITWHVLTEISRYCSLGWKDKLTKML